MASKRQMKGKKLNAIPVATCGGQGDSHCDPLPPPQCPNPGTRPYPFHAFQVSFQQTVQREGDDVVHILNLKRKSTEDSQRPF